MNILKIIIEAGRASIKRLSPLASGREALLVFICELETRYKELEAEANRGG
jgi:hypothetical protein